MSHSDDSLPISALQHWLYCPRQCALIHIERLWEENRLTAEGRVLHERADAGRSESRDGVHTLRAVPIASEVYNLHGVADVVEMQDGVPHPIEYKRGRPKAHRADEVQLCAQVLCLEEMTGREIAQGALYYGERRRRVAVSFDAEPCSALPVARAVVAAKIANQRAILRRHLRDHADAPGADAVDNAQRRLADAARLALDAPDLETLRGHEGESAQACWSVFARLILLDDSTLAFAGRNRRPPRDPVNAVLSFLYALLSLDARAACESHGLDPQMGFLHRDRPGRMSLALDLMEELRAPLADRTALSLLNRRQITASDFERQETGAVLLVEAGRRKVLQGYHDRKRVELRHGWLGERIPLGLVVQLQAQLLARHLRGDIDAYPAWIWS